MLNIINLEEIYLKFIFLLLLPEIHIWEKKKKKLMNLWVNLGPILGQLRGVGAEAEEPKVESKDLAE